jgi:hypothetical protein
MAELLQQPTPFNIVRRDGLPDVATNGACSLVCPDAGGVIRLRRGIRGAFGAPAAEKILPHLNQLATELLSNSAMSPADVAARLHALQLVCMPDPLPNIEWAYAELDGVRVYTNGQTVILTRQDLAVNELANG